MKLFEEWIDNTTKAYPDEVPPEVLMEMLTYLAGLILLYALCFLVTGVVFAFAYQLVVDKKLSGWQATKLSARGARENFGGVMGLLLLELALGTFGVMLCCFGLVLVMPITKAAWAVAYAEVFLPHSATNSGSTTTSATHFLWGRPTIWRIFFRMNLNLTTVPKIRRGAVISMKHPIESNTEGVIKFQPRPGSPRGQPAWGGSVTPWGNESRANRKTPRVLARGRHQHQS